MISPVLTIVVSPDFPRSERLDQAARVGNLATLPESILCRLIMRSRVLRSTSNRRAAAGGKEETINCRDRSSQCTKQKPDCKGGLGRLLLRCTRALADARASAWL